MQRSERGYLLQGLMVCQCCKYTYYGMSGIMGGHSYYRCPGNRFCGCNSKSIRTEILETAIWEKVKMVLKEPEVIAKEHQLRLLKQEEMIDEKKLQLDFTISSVKSFASEIESDWEAKLNIIRALVKRIEIDHDNIHIVFRLKELALERQKKNVQHCIRSLEPRIIKNIVLPNTIGMHKVSNALAAISVAIKLGISDADIKKGLLEFKGVARRFSLIANIKGVKLIEDYAHHPNEIYATLTAARSITKGKVIGIIEPLRFARVRNFFGEFIRIFMMFDYVILTPIHPPEDKPIPGCGIDDIQKALISNGFNNTKIMNDSLLISRFISDSTSPGDIVLFIGAGSNIAKLAKETAKLITETIQTFS